MIQVLIILNTNKYKLGSKNDLAYYMCCTCDVTAWLPWCNGLLLGFQMERSPWPGAPRSKYTLSLGHPVSRLSYSIFINFIHSISTLYTMRQRITGLGVFFLPK